jgi:hypothetical protein
MLVGHFLEALYRTGSRQRVGYEGLIRKVGEQVAIQLTMSMLLRKIGDGKFLFRSTG